MLKNIAHVRDILKLAPGSMLLFFATAGISLMAAIGEAAGVFVFIPLLQSTGASAVTPNAPFIGSIIAWLDELSFSNRIQAVAVIIIVVVIVRAAMELLNRVMINVLRMYVQRKLAEALYNAIIYANLRYIDRQRSGRMMAQIDYSLFQIPNIVANLGNILFNCVLICGYVVLMVLVSLQLTLLAIGMMLGLSAAISLILVKQNQAGRKLISSTIDCQNRIAETVGNVRMLRLLVAEQSHFRKFSNVLRGKTWAQFLVYALSASIQPIFSLGGGLFFAAALLFGSWYFGDGDRAWVSSAILLIVILYRMVTPISALNTARTELTGDFPALQEVQAFRAEAAADRFVNGSRRVDTFKKRIAFEHVDFSYGREPNIGEMDRVDRHPAQLKDFNLEIKRGEMIALVGPTGAGKTTVVNLLARLYDPTSGRITIDGVNLRDVDVYTWRARIGFISQDVTLFHGTIAENLRVVRPDATREAMENALRSSGAAGLLTSLPDGLDTVVGERGASLSGGQRQRIALARALLQEPDVLILDEATNQLDSLTERLVNETIASLKGRTTVIVIAHRLNTVIQADRILVMDNGCVVQSGPHADLSQQDGLYRRLLNEQVRGLEHGGLAEKVVAID